MNADLVAPRLWPDAQVEHAYEAEATLWVLRDQAGAAVLRAAGWSPDATENTDQVAGVPTIEARYRRAL